jgi:hypothetical protein
LNAQGTHNAGEDTPAKLNPLNTRQAGKDCPDRLRRHRKYEKKLNDRPRGNLSFRCLLNHTTHALRVGKSPVRGCRTFPKFRRLVPEFGTRITLNRFLNVSPEVLRLEKVMYFKMIREFSKKYPAGLHTGITFC